MGTIYCWFESLFGQNLGEYLWGYSCDTQVYSNSNLFNSIGIIAILLSLIFVLAYYYLPLKFFNHPRSSRWWNWLIILLLSGIINFIIGYGWTINDFLNGNIGDCLMNTRDEAGNIISQLIFRKDCWLFGLTNLLFSSMFYIVFSFSLKWKSHNNRYSPF